MRLEMLLQEHREVPRVCTTHHWVQTDWVLVRGRGGSAGCHTKSLCTQQQQVRSGKRKHSAWMWGPWLLLTAQHFANGLFHCYISETIMLNEEKMSFDIRLVEQCKGKFYRAEVFSFSSPGNILGYVQFGFVLKARSSLYWYLQSLTSQLLSSLNLCSWGDSGS